MAYNLPTIAATTAEIVRRLQALTWTPTVGDPVAAFESVLVFEATDREAALERYISSEGRIAIVVYSGDTFARLEQGPRYGIGFDTQTNRTFSILISDRYLTNATYAMRGTDTNPGAYALFELAVAALAGVLLDGPPTVYCEPQAFTPGASPDTDSEPGRAGGEFTLKCWTDWRQVTSL